MFFICNILSRKIRGSQAPILSPPDKTSTLKIVALLCAQAENCHCYDNYQLRYRRRLTRWLVFRTNPPSRVPPTRLHIAIHYKQRLHVAIHSFSMTPFRTDKSLSPAAADSIVQYQSYPGRSEPSPSHNPTMPELPTV